MNDLAAWKPNVTPDELIENFEFLGDWEERYRYIIDLGRKLPELPVEEKTEARRVIGCQSQVWLIPQVREGDPPVIEFLADSDAHIVRGLIAILLATYSGKTADEILAYDADALFDTLGLKQHLSGARSNGLVSMVRRIKELANEIKAGTV